MIYLFWNGGYKWEKAIKTGYLKITMRDNDIRR